MAYVVSRPKGRFEIRESVHTAQGPRARSLANFARLSDEVLATAAGRATRPFDAGAVRAAARRAGAPVGTEVAPGSDPIRPGRRRFVASSRRMARSLQAPRPAEGQSPGDALVDLLGFVAQIVPFRPAAAPEPLRFPPLAHLRAQRVDRPAGR